MVTKRFLQNIIDQKKQFLLPLGEGQDEGIHISQLPIYPLSPTLSRRERELTEQQ